MYNVVLDFTGWKKFTLKRSDFSTVRTPLGWDKIDQLVFYTNWGTSKTNTSLEVKMSDFSMFDVVGPVVGDVEFFNALNFSIPQLSSVKQAVQDKDYSKAKSAFCTYLKFERNNVPWSFNPRKISSAGIASSYITKAKETLSGKITVVSIPYTFADPENINWNYNPTAQPGSPDPYDAEWTWQLNRMSFWTDLGRALWYANGTSQMELAQNITNLFAAQLNSWVISQPRPTFANQAGYSAWRTIEAGIRLSTSWAEIYHRFLTVLPCDDLHTLVKSIYEQAIYLHTYRTTGNWLTMECNGLFTAGAVFPEFKLSSTWRSIAISTMYNESVAQFLSDGAQYELSTGYHHVSIDNIIGLYLTAKTVGIVNEFPVDYVNRLQKALEFDISIMTPSLYMPGPLNDGWDYQVYNYITTYASYFPDSALIKWLMNRNVNPAPSFNSTLLKDCGFMVMRSGWSSSDNYALMDISPLGYGHEHQDKLNVIIDPYGRRRLLFDNGGGEYEQSIYRTFATSTESHNTVMVDGFSQKRVNRVANDLTGYGKKETPLPVFETTQLIDYARGVYIDAYRNTSYFPANHTREFLFVKPTHNLGINMYVAIDTLKSADGNPHHYQARWHLRTTNVKFDSKFNSLVTNDTGVPNLMIIPLSTSTLAYHAIAQTTPFILGFDIQRGVDPTPATSLVHYVENVKDALMVTLLIPLKTGENVNITQVEEIVKDSSYKITLQTIGGLITTQINLSYLQRKDIQDKRRIEITQSTATSSIIYQAIAPTPVSCPTSGYSGVECDMFNCFGISSTNSSSVCSGNGNCTKPDQCTCLNGFTGLNCSSIIPKPQPSLYPSPKPQPSLYPSPKPQPSAMTSTVKPVTSSTKPTPGQSVKVQNSSIVVPKNSDRVSSANSSFAISLFWLIILIVFIIHSSQ
ncbi:predicted protein [Naegleria gruberi]|uniref:Predicted protein n=1 Tax=Naegleria gruberi TaxID=5762 RepID=D2VY06_NAEGR|nr:uncharacterized protein NAEGRDRAFT_73926 [Naegleria gruberi]EFC38282.1 predicted protein [Naegleria gruberi]|eukprot:XP_002671026.1 predicted protein [Naegleria gruberi strain NEG-M]